MKRGLSANPLAATRIESISWSIKNSICDMKHSSMAIVKGFQLRLMRRSQRLRTLELF
jgi:hypothetical protein